MKAKRLRRSIAVPLAITFLALWLGTMILLTGSVCDKLEKDVRLAYRTARDELEEQWDIYQRNLANGLGREADSILRHNLSSAAAGLVDMDGGMAIAVRDSAGKEVRSQLAFGYGHEEGVDQGPRWSLELDGGLDDAGQMALARWIIANRTNNWSYDIYPSGNENYQGDGTVARVTGFDEGGYSLRVRRIELVRPDGSVETAVETAAQGEDPVTLEFTFMRLSSVLLPSWVSDGDGDHRDGYTDMERRLANFRETQAILDRAFAGENRSVRTGDGGMVGTTGGWDDGDMARYVAYQCQVLPTALRQQAFLYGSTLVLAALVLLVLSAYLSRRVTDPVETLCASVQRGGPCGEDGPIRELNTLSAAFNAAQGKLESDLKREQELTRAVAHELKTPLAVLRSHAEALLEDIDPAKREHYLAVIMEESDRMAALVKELLDLSRLEAGAEGLRLGDVDLAALARRVFERLRRPLEEKGCRLTLELEEVRVRGDGEKLERAVTNYAANSLRHCAPGGEVRVKLSTVEDRARLAVENDGENIPAADLPRLFDTFFRGDAARSRDGGGAGLGLAIVRGVVDLHGGRCGAENLMGGVRFWLELPAQPG